MKKTIAILLSLLLICGLFAGCGSSASFDKGYAAATPTAPSWAEESANTSAGYYDGAYYENGYYEDGPYKRDPGYAVSTGNADVDESVSISDSSEKIIYSASVYLETTDFDASVAAIEAMVKELGGYIQDSSNYGYVAYTAGSTGKVVDRTAYYTIAIPSSHFEAALNRSGEIGNVTNQSRNAENITSQYTDVASRVESLRVQEERLLEMMKATEDVDSLIKLEERLSEVTYEKEIYQRTLLNYDRRVAYSTISYTVSEVEIYTPVTPVQRTFGQKLADSFRSGVRSFIWDLEDFVLWFAESIIGIAIFVGIVVLIVVLIKRVVKKSRAKQAARQAAGVQTAPQTADPRGTDN